MTFLAMFVTVFALVLLEKNNIINFLKIIIVFPNKGCINNFFYIPNT